MRLISHRGNVSGPNLENENKPSFIQTAIDEGYDVEVDVRLLDAGLYLGHDNPDYPVELEWLVARKDRLWIHTKNFQAMNLLIEHDLKVFYHQTEKHAVIGNTRFIWSCDLTEATERSVIPLIGEEETEKYKDVIMNFYAVCSDYIRRFAP